MKTQTLPSTHGALGSISKGVATATVALLALLPVASISIALAQPLRLVERPTDGRGIPYAPPRDPTVCKAYLRNLNAMASSAMECERMVQPGSREFAKPRWQPLNPAEHLELIRKMERRMYPKNPRDDEAWLKRFHARVRENSIALSVAELDVINDDGIPEKVIRYEPSGACGPDSPRYIKEAGAQYFVVDDGLKDFAWQFKDRIFLVPGVRHDAFIYRGKVYFDFISDAARPAPKRLIVQETHADLRPTPVCVYEHAKTNNAPKGAR